MNIKGFCFNADSSPLSLKLTEKPLRKLEKDEVLVRNTAIGLNPVDYKVLEGFGSHRRGQIIGVDGVGVVESGFKNVRAGIRVAYHCDLNYDGSYATHTIIKERALLFLPHHISDTQAAMLPCPALTAMQCIQKISNLFNKDVLVFGAGGAVGRILCSLLAESGARIVGICGKRHHEALGKRGIACHEYNDFTSTSSFDVIFDCMGVDSALWLKRLRYYGHFVAVLNRVENPSIEPFSTCVSLHEIALGAIHSHGDSRDFRILRQNASYIFNNIDSLLLPELEVVEFEKIPQALNRLKTQNLGVKFVARV